MINLEFYKDEIIDKYINRDEIKYFDCILCEIKNKSLDCQKTCYQCLEKSFDWLLEEHKEPIKLKQWEYDLIIKVTESINQIGSFETYKVLYKMKRMGYFRGVTNIKMTVEEILTNCEVVE